jgi:hypothetical protein
VSASDLPASPSLILGIDASEMLGENHPPRRGTTAVLEAVRRPRPRGNATKGRGRLGAIGFGRPEKRDELYDMPPLWSERPLARTLPSTRALPSLRGARPDVGSDAALRGEAAPVEDGSGGAGL